jgi:hypothetical protein
MSKNKVNQGTQYQDTKFRSPIESDQLRLNSPNGISQKEGAHIGREPG